MAYQLLKDTEKEKEKEKAKKEEEKEEGEKKEEEDKPKKAKTVKSDGTELVILNPISGKEYRFEKVTELIEGDIGTLQPGPGIIVRVLGVQAADKALRQADFG